MSKVKNGSPKKYNSVISSTDSSFKLIIILLAIGKSPGVALEGLRIKR